MVIRRARRVVVQNYDGTALVSTRFDLYPVQRGAGTHYLNGQPVLPPLSEVVASRLITDENDPPTKASEFSLAG